MPADYLALIAQEIDCKLKPGDTQHFYFREDDPPPFYDLDAPKFDTDTGKRNRKKQAIVKEGYVGKPKGAPHDQSTRFIINNLGWRARVHLH